MNEKNEIKQKDLKSEVEEAKRFSFLIEKIYELKGSKSKVAKLFQGNKSLKGQLILDLNDREKNEIKEKFSFDKSHLKWFISILAILTEKNLDDEAKIIINYIEEVVSESYFFREKKQKNIFSSWYAGKDDFRNPLLHFDDQLSMLKYKEDDKEKKLSPSSKKMLLLISIYWLRIVKNVDDDLIITGVLRSSKSSKGPKNIFSSFMNLYDAQPEKIIIFSNSRQEKIAFLENTITGLKKDLQIQKDMSITQIEHENLFNSLKESHEKVIDSLKKINSESEKNNSLLKDEVRALESKFDIRTKQLKGGFKKILADQLLPKVLLIKQAHENDKNQVVKFKLNDLFEDITEIVEGSTYE